MIFIREMTPPTIRFGTTVMSLSTPSMRTGPADRRPRGSRWMSGGALLDRLADELMHEPDDRSVVGGLVQLDDSTASSAVFALVVGGVVHGVARPCQARDHVGDVLAAVTATRI